MKKIQSREPFNWANYRKYRNYVNGQIKRVKIAHYHNAFHVNEGDIGNT